MINCIFNVHTYILNVIAFTCMLCCSELTITLTIKTRICFIIPTTQGPPCFVHCIDWPKCSAVSTATFKLIIGTFFRWLFFQIVPRISTLQTQVVFKSDKLFGSVTQLQYPHKSTVKWLTLNKMILFCRTNPAVLTIKVKDFTYCHRSFLRRTMWSLGSPSCPQHMTWLLNLL